MTLPHDAFSDDSADVAVQINSLILAAERGDLTDAEMERLDRLVRECPQARRVYAQYMVETVDLCSWAACPDPTDIVPDAPILPSAAPAQLGSIAGAPVQIESHHGPLAGAFFGTVHFFSETGPLSYLVATLVMLVLGAVAWNWKLPDRVEIVRDAGLPVLRQPSTGPDMTFIGRITGMVDCQWADPKTETIEGAYVPLGRKYALASGLMEITYDTGAKVILQGPVTYEVESSSGGYLSLGKLTAKLEKKSEIRGQRSVPVNQKSEIRNPKFAVRTPTSLITDLGTEFAVEVAKDGSNETHVFVGSVRLEPLGAAQRARTLSSGQTAHVHADSKTITMRNAADVDTRRFIRVMPASEYAWRGDAYAKFVSGLNPVAYYCMEPSQDGASDALIPDSATAGHHGALHAGRPTHQRYGRGLLGNALWLGGPGSDDFVVVDNYPKTQTNQLTVSAWVYAVSRPIWASIAKNWGKRNHGQFFLGLTADDGDLSVYVEDAAGKDVCVREGHASPFPRGCWQHVAFVVDGQSVCLYRNGRQVASRPIAGINPSPAAANLGIGAKLDDTGDRAVSKVSDCWHGWIDELALWHRALTPQEIGELANRCDPGRNRSHDASSDTIPHK
jgi:hypothetical protein